MVEFIKIMETNKKLIKVVAVVALVVVLGVLYYFKVIPGSLFRSRAYQAVFLSNGQVYFGKLYSERNQYPVLRDVFYLQVAQAPQPSQPGQASPQTINIVKLGGELHNPTDEMRINRDHILFIEDLKADSRVLQAIVQFKAQNK